MQAPSLRIRPAQTLADELDALYRDTRAKVGAEDLLHIQNVRAYSNAIEARGRALIEGRAAAYRATPGDLRSVSRGVKLRALRVLLEFSELGHSIMHGSYDHLCHLPGGEEFHSESYRWSLCADPTQWRTMHHLNHHPKTGIVGLDHDMGFSAARLHPGQNWYVHHAFQPLLLAVFLHPTLVFASYTASSAARTRGKGAWDLEALRVALRELLDHSKVEHLRPLKKHLGAFRVFSAFKETAANYLSQTLGYDGLALLLLIEHHADNVDIFADPGPDETTIAYYRRQIRATTNFSWTPELVAGAERLLAEEVAFANPPPFEVFFGGLDTHLEHHLFPDLPCARQREIAPQVKAICERHGEPYNILPITKAVPQVFRRLFPQVAPLGESERIRQLVKKPLRLFRRLIDGARYENPNPERYLKRTRMFNAISRVTEKRTLAAGSTTYLRLSRPRGWEDMEWPAGAFISLRVDVGGESLVRQYSLLRASGAEAKAETLDIAIRRVSGGLVSNALAKLSPGDRVTLVGPPVSGGLSQTDLTAPTLYIAGGVGITPILSILRERVRGGHAAPATLLYFNRTRSSALFCEELRALCAASKINPVEFYDEESAPRMSPFVLEKHVKRHACIVACAPPSLLGALEEARLALGVSDEQLHTEAFAAPNVLRRTPTGKTHLVRFVRSEVELEVDESTTLLEAAKEAGLNLPSGCQRGLCRACACTRLSGESIDSTQMPGAPESNANLAAPVRITLCNSFPRGTVDLDA